MLMSTQASRYAHKLLKARAAGTLLEPLTASDTVSVADAYDIAKSILDIRIAQGETQIGRKIGFSNRKMGNRYGMNSSITEPIWSPLFDSSVEFAMDNRTLYSLKKAQQPRIEPELVFKLARTPAPDITLEGLAQCLEWMAHGFEIVTSPYPEWQFDTADAIAAFGLHKALIVGEPRLLSAATRRNLVQVLGASTLSLSRTANGTPSLVAAGFGKDVAGSPLHALWHLHQQLQSQSTFQPLQAGEIITTGSWTDAHPVQRGEVWSSAFLQIGLPGLTVSFS
jgi:2-keto-4-pentenoate hydratase